MEFLQDMHYRAAGFGVQVAGRLVGEDYRGRVDQGPGDGHTLFFPTGNLIGEIIRAVAEAHGGDGFLRQAVNIFAVSVNQRQFDVVEHRSARQKVEGLENEADPLVADASQFVVGEVGGVFAFKKIFSGCGAVQEAHDVHQGGLAAPGGPHNRQEFSLPNA